MSQEAEFKRAFFTPQTGPNAGKAIGVHFNPGSLQYTISNTLENKGRGNSKKQYVAQSPGKLTMDLIFDTTHDGQDVRTYTEKIAGFMEPQGRIPSIVQFEWGTYKFQGMVESYKETLDFFAPNGVPLRASINLTLVNQDKVFEPSKTSSFDTHGALGPEPIEVPTGADQDATRTATQGGDPRAGREIAAANNQESMRFLGGSSLLVGGGVRLGEPVAFASGGLAAGFEIGAGAGVSTGIDSGAGIGISGGLGATAGIGVSGSLEASTQLGGSLGAAASAGPGTSVGLRTRGQLRKRTSAFDPQRLIHRSSSLNLATDSGAHFQTGGKASFEGSTSLSADVGASASLRNRIQFEED